MSAWAIQFMQLFVIPIVIGLLTSLLFLLLISRVRPKIEISPEIAKVKSKKYPGKFAYVVKVTNKSGRAAVDIKVRFAIVEDKSVPNGKIPKFTDFKLEKNSEFEIPGLDRSNPKLSALRFLTYDDIEARWTNRSSHLVFLVHAKDSLTGFGQVFKQKYFLKRLTIKEGTFKVGTSMEIA